MKLPSKYKKRRERNATEDNAIAALDELSEFEQWKQTVLPALAKDAEKGMNAGEMREKYAAILQAKMISIGLLEKRASAAIVAIKDVLDRVEGKAVEVKEVKHKLETLSEEELDAVLKTKLKDVAGIIDVTPDE